MRALLVAVAMVLLNFQTVLSASEEISIESKESRQIQILKDQIVQHEQIARYADRQAERLMTRDFTTYRQYIRIRDKNQAIADELKKKVEEMENLPPHLRK